MDRCNLSPYHRPTGGICSPHCITRGQIQTQSRQISKASKVASKWGARKNGSPPRQSRERNAENSLDQKISLSVGSTVKGLSIPHLWPLPTNNAKEIGAAVSYVLF